MHDAVVRDVALPGGAISYHRFGVGDVVLAGPIGAFYSVSGVLASPIAGGFARALGQFAHCVLMDRRGLGFSDPLPTGWEPTIERQADDLLAVLDHAGVERAILLAIGFDAQAVLWFAAHHPARTAGVIAVGTTPKLVRAPDHPSGVDPGFIERWAASMDPASASPAVSFTNLLAPSMAHDDGFDRWLRDVGRHAASPETARRYLRVAAGADVRDVSTRITAPLLVLHHAGDAFIDADDARLLARLAPAGRLRLYPLDGHAFYVGATAEKLTDIERFATGRSGRSRRRRLRVGWAALTPAQQQVARLVAAGRTNPEIATTLGVSNETVKSHVSAALRTTGLRSRTELATLVTTQAGGPPSPA